MNFFVNIFQKKMSIIESSFIIGLDKNDKLIKESQNININDLLKNFNQYKSILLHTMIKNHNNFNYNEGKDDFIFIIRNGDIINKKEIIEANNYIKQSNRSYYFEGIKQYNNSNLFYMIWGS
jgi:hypothetical protein